MRRRSRVNGRISVRRLWEVGAILVGILVLAGSTGVVSAGASKTAPAPRFTVTPINRTGGIAGAAFTGAVFTFKDTAAGVGTTYSTSINWGDGTAPSAGTQSGGPTYTVTGLAHLRGGGHVPGHPDDHTV